MSTLADEHWFTFGHETLADEHCLVLHATCLCSLTERCPPVKVNRPGHFFQGPEVSHLLPHSLFPPRHHPYFFSTSPPSLLSPSFSKPHSPLLYAAAMSVQRGVEGAQGWQGRGVARVAGRQNVATRRGRGSQKKRSGPLFESKSHHSHHNI